MLTGPLMHASALHYLVDGPMLVLIYPLAAALYAWCSASILASGVLVSAWAQLRFGEQVLGQLAGMSGGLYALLGALGASFLVYSNVPRGLPVLCLLFALAGVLAAEAASPAAATVCHLVGWCWGAVGVTGLAWMRAGEQKGR